MAYEHITDEQIAELVEYAKEALQDITYSFPSGKRTRKRTYTAAEIRELHEQSPSSLYYSDYKFDLPIFHHGPLLRLVRRMLNEPEQLAVGEPRVAQGYDDSMVSVVKLHDTMSTIRCILRGATFMGAETMARMFVRWLRGEPAQGMYIGILRGIKISRDIGPVGGIRISHPPVPDPDEAMNHLPWSSMPHVDPLRYTQTKYDGSGQRTLRQQVILTVPQQLAPAIYTSQSRPDAKPRTSWGSYKNSGQFPFNIFDRLLSLACNSHVYTQLCWTYYEHLQIFEGRRSSILGWGSEPRGRIRRMQPSALGRAMKLYRVCKSAFKQNKSLPVALARWHTSTDGQRSLLDRFIDLRIALEALYLPNETMELGHKLASRAAWYLGSSADKRTELFKNVKKFYAMSSKIIHASTQRIAPQQRTILSNAQSICRASILKRLEQSAEPEWDAMTLDAIPMQETVHAESA